MNEQARLSVRCAIIVLVYSYTIYVKSCLQKQKKRGLNKICRSTHREEACLSGLYSQQEQANVGVVTTCSSVGGGTV
jgi:hypothetical protein